MSKNTKMTFMYRDADNYKSFSDVILSGTMSDDDLKAIKENLDRGMFFIPHQLGLPTPAEQMQGYDGFPNDELDHGWTTFPDVKNVSEFETYEPPTHDMPIKVFVERMKTEDWCVMTEWDRYINL